MVLRAVGVLGSVLLVVGLGTGARLTAAADSANSAPPTVWFLTIHDSVGRVQAGSPPKIYDNPFHCAQGEDDCNLRGIAATSGALWLPDSNNGLRRLDPKTGRPANSINDNRYSSAPVVWDGRLWFTNVDKLLGVRPPAMGVVTTVKPPTTYVDQVASSPHFLWTVGTGMTRSDHVGVERLSRAGRVESIDLPISGDVTTTIGALDDGTAYVVVTPNEPSGGQPSGRLFRIAISSHGSKVDDLGVLPFAAGTVVPIGDHLWFNDVNQARLVALNLDGRPVSQINLGLPGDGQLVGAFGRLWYMASSDAGGSVLDVADPASGSVISSTPITLPAGDRVGPFTVAP